MYIIPPENYTFFVMVKNWSKENHYSIYLSQFMVVTSLLFLRLRHFCGLADLELAEKWMELGTKNILYPAW